MKAKREQAYGDLLIIKLFASNYARDLVLTANKIFHSNNKKGYTMYQEFLCLTDTTGFIFTNKA
jgi:hypothetical protein